ncbi:Retrovirus-related Pol polyprotein from transposon RE1 [Sesamum angolense]|uniref:Retrovirus-related Pol polyprotein from transposon RE1 n=1 Tax=Sesamum angolense TaxID=2727404 RepID=A0AAE1WWK5_9LAMI|nr:Retrovirus-related Pol polyprotein from transposon RE1 [Sesamum angolense]
MTMGRIFQISESAQTHPVKKILDSDPKPVVFDPIELDCDTNLFFLSIVDCNGEHFDYNARQRNWRDWLWRSMRIALEGRDKLGFIDGSCIKPGDGTTELRQWHITDSMARYGECDGPLLYKIQRQISSMSQGNLDVTAYYTNLKQLWDELVCLMPPAMCTCGKCTCGCNKAKIDQTEASQLMQFLMGLNEIYDNIRNQILVLDPLPNVNKAYSMVLRVERQREVNLGFAETGHNVVMQARSYDSKGPGPRNYLKKKGPTDKRNLVCGHCNKLGHSKETCFKIHGVPDWYRDLNDQRKKNGGSGRAYTVNDSVQQSSVDNISAASHNLVAELMETLKMVQNKVPYDPVKVHFAQNSEVAGTTLSKSSRNVNAGSWIVDTGATSHMCELYTLWHKRLGHASPFVLSHIPVLSFTNKNKEHICSICPLAKQTRAFRCVFLGYVHGQKAYKLYDIDNKIQLLFLLHPLQAKGCLEWEKAMKEELDALERNNTWEIVDLLPGKKPIGSKWVSKVKLRPDGSVDRYKVRLVAKGYNQVEGVDYVDRFSPIAKAVTLRLLLAVASSKNWPIQKIDINNAFLHGSLDEDIYLTAPDGYPIPAGKTTDGFLVLLVYVDGVLINGSSQLQIDKVKHFLHSTFTIKDLGPAKYFLGLEIARSTEGLSVTQHKYIRDIILDICLQNSKPATTPLSTGLKLSAHDVVPLHEPEPYRRLVGRLLYLSFTRPDISFGAQQLSQFVHQSGQIHMDAALHLVRYLKGSPDRGLFFSSSNSFTLTAFCDTDWASCVYSRRSLTGYCIFLGQALISWKTKKQTTVARSTAEAEYRSLDTTVCELQWISYLLFDFHISIPRLIPVYCDNQAAIHIVANPVFHEQTKQLEIDCHLVRDKFKAGFVLPSHISGKSQLADLFTKLLPSPTFTSFLSKLGLVSFPQSSLRED